MHYVIINARNILVVGPRMLGGQTEDEYQYHVSRSRRFSLFQQLGGEAASVFERRQKY